MESHISSFILFRAVHVLLAKGEVQVRGITLPEQGVMVLIIPNMVQIKASFLDGWH